MAHGTVKALQTIEGNLTSFGTMVRHMALATQEQNRTGEDAAKQVETSVAEAMQSASADTQMAATTEQVARAAQGLAIIAQELAHPTAEFRV